MGCTASKSETNDLVWKMVMQHQMTALSSDSIYTLDPFTPSSPKGNAAAGQGHAKLSAEAVAQARARAICAVCGRINDDVRGQPDGVRSLDVDVELLGPHIGRPAVYSPAEGGYPARVVCMPDDLPHIRQLLEYLGFRAKVRRRTTLQVSWT
eukprot:EG_transcript_15352